MEHLVSIFELMMSTNDEIIMSPPKKQLILQKPFCMLMVYGILNICKLYMLGKCTRFSSSTFPSADTIEVRCTYLQNKHWLLSVAWVRLFKKERSAAEYVRSSKELFLTDKDDILKLQEIYDYKEI